MGVGIVRIVRLRLRPGIKSFITPTITVAMSDGLPLARRQLARLSADSSARRHTKDTEVQND